MSRHQVLNSNQTKEWNSYLEIIGNGRTDIYFAPEYYRIYEDYNDGEAKCFVFEYQGETAIYPFLMNQINDLGYTLDSTYFDIQGAYGYNGIISTTEEPEFFTNFYKTFGGYCINHNIIAEFTRFHPLIGNHKYSEKHLNIIPDRFTVQLNLDKPDQDIWQSEYSSVNRNMIRKAEKIGVKIRVGSNEADYDSFQEMYKTTMSNLTADGYYYFDKKYFTNFRSLLSDRQVLLLAQLDDKIVAGALFMYDSYYAHYHLSARDNKYGNIPATNLLLHHAIRLAREKGCKKFHFGGGTTSDSGDLLLRFKKNFSKTLTSFCIGKKIHNSGMYNVVVQQWKERYPEISNQYDQLLLKYRYLR